MPGDNLFDVLSLRALSENVVRFTEFFLRFVVWNAILFHIHNSEKIPDVISGLQNRRTLNRIGWFLFSLLLTV